MSAIDRLARQCHPLFRRMYEREMRAANFAMEIKPGEGTEIKILKVCTRGPNGSERWGYNVLLCDTTRHSSKDRAYGRPVLLNAEPFAILEEAEQFALERAAGRQVFYHRGARAKILGTPPDPPVQVILREQVGSELLRKAG